jgi:hypothetical protein
MRDLRGIHWPNVAISQDDAAQALRVAGPDGAITLLHTELGWYDTLRHNAPERLIHVRMYTPNWTTLDPAAWAEETVKALGPRLLADPFVAVSFANEQNLHHEAGDANPGHQWQYQTVEWYERLATWNLDCLRAFDALAPGRKCLTVTSALADGHEPPGYPPDGEYTIPLVREMLHAFDLVGIHPYALMHEQPQSGATGKLAYWYMLRPFRTKGYKDRTDPGGVVNQYPERLFLVTETGTFTHADTARTDDTWRELATFYRACQECGRVVGITPFIWATDAAHPQNNMQPNDELRSILEHAPRYETKASLPTRGGQNVADLVKLLTAELGSLFADIRGQLPDVTSPQYGKFGPRPLSAINYLAIHHTAGPAWQSAQAIYDYHVKNNGWSGIGYSYLIYPNGAVRYVGSLETSRANVADHNDEVAGIAFVGTFTDAVPTDAALASGARLVKALRAFLGRRVPVVPHRHFGGTICPGNRWQEWLGVLDDEPEPAVDPDGRAVWDKASWAVNMAADYLDNEAKLIEDDAPQDAQTRRFAAQRIRDDYGRDAARKRDAREV